ncbi:MAG TPA: ROK family protein [Bacteroidota bacterium]|nr:ROK family protein [Bacteroidota bacterium]
MDYRADKRIVMTLDAGGTNFVFTAIRGNEQILSEITLASHADDLDRCLASVVEGFQKVEEGLPSAPSAISFAFPGPADYPRGIIGDLPNLPAFRGGVALGPFLKEKFGLPVFINNDGDLFAFGEAIAGYLPYVNALLERAGSSKRFKNVLGLTIGTGFGAGIVRDGDLFLGDNSIAGEIWLLRNKLHPETNIEESVSIRAVRRMYAREACIAFEGSPSPKEIFEISRGISDGNRAAAIKAFQEMGEAAGDAIANAMTLIDGLVVIGGGLAGAADIFLPAIVKEMNGTFISPDGKQFRRLVAHVYNLEDKADLEKFLKGSVREIGIYGTDKKIAYDPEARIGVGVSKIGTSKAISLGAYAFALNALDR